LRALPGPPLLGLELGFDALSLLFWLATVGVLLATALRGWGGRWLQITAGLYLLPALCTSTQILARFPDYTRVWIDLASICAISLISSRQERITKPWLAAGAILSMLYLTGYGFVA